MSDGKLRIPLPHDRVVVRLVDEDGERRSVGGMIPATARAAERLSWGEVEVRGRASLVARERARMPWPATAPSTPPASSCDLDRHDGDR